jgi:hypothetical protein
MGFSKAMEFAAGVNEILKSSSSEVMDGKESGGFFLPVRQAVATHA